MTIRRGDILWADLGMFPTTSVQGGVRPVIVVSNNKANTYSSVITVVPLTARNRILWISDSIRLFGVFCIKAPF